MVEETRKQLQMIWPADRLKSPPDQPAPAGYALRAYAESDAGDYVALMRAAGFSTWDAEKTRNALARCLPGGLFVLAHHPTGKLVATAMAIPTALENHPNGGELGWVAGDPAHKGKNLGCVVCAAATRRFLKAGFSDIFLRTDDYRLAAIKTYLKLGYAPLLFAPDMRARWNEVFRLLKMKERL